MEGKRTGGVSLGDELLDLGLSGVLADGAEEVSEGGGSNVTGALAVKQVESLLELCWLMCRESRGEGD